MTYREVDVRECGCHIGCLMNGTVTANQRIAFCPDHDPGFCTYEDYYGRTCWKLKHEGDDHRDKSGPLLPPNWEPQRGVL